MNTGVSAGHMWGGRPNCAKRRRNPKKGLDKPSATLWNLKLIFSCAQRKAQSVFVFVFMCACICASEELSGHKEAHSYLDEWLAQSLLVDFQHNVPDLLIRQAERAQENCCRDEEKRESFLLLILKSNSCLPRQISEIIPQSKCISDVVRGKAHISFIFLFFCFHQERVPGIWNGVSLTFNLHFYCHQ